ncbi:MAG: hypothetical protein PVI57_06910 [Gemmatimonadota bacterium]|jgi:hypothetical protein
MRAFQDEDGRAWDVVAGRESWGAIFAIFIPRRGAPEGPDGGDTPPVRQALLEAVAYGDANVELERMSDDDLRRLLHRSVPKNTG